MTSFGKVDVWKAYIGAASIMESRQKREAERETLMGYSPAPDVFGMIESWKYENIKTHGRCSMSNECAFRLHRCEKVAIWSSTSSRRKIGEDVKRTREREAILFCQESK